MNQQEFADTARRYREELLRMYRSQSITPPPKPEETPYEVQKPEAKSQVGSEGPEPLPTPTIAPVSPPPLPIVPIEEVPTEVPIPPPQPEPSSPPEAYMGTILVRVTTAKGARPVSGATVVITKEDASGEESLLSLQVTGQSGEITRVPVPAPPPSADQRRPEAFHYDITVFAVGYYRETGKNIPVFPDIVSVQSFDLIPLPAGVEDSTITDALTFYNTMPGD